MATIHKWSTPEAVTTLLSTGLNSLAHATAAVSGEVDNSAGLYKLADFELVVGNANVLGGFISLYLIESEDGTNFEDADIVNYAGVVSYGITAHLIGAFVPDTAAARKILSGIPLPPCKFKVALLNGAFQFAASGNTVKMIRYYEQNA